ncbi:hypothetical protein [Bartonella sp. DGB2]|uniref:hypothetical protein n=1 Tax=Bartonella sp. DGB2 TaxID=3388426 RepID=UPI0039903628
MIANTPEYLCKVEEGIRFGNAAERKANINLLNPLEPRVMLNGNFALPAYSPKLRLDLAGKDGEIILSQYTVRSGVNMVQKTRTRTRIRYGVTRSVCTNSSWWNSGRYDPVTGIFRRDGETWEVTPEDRRNAAAHTGYVRVTQFWYDSYDEAYWDAQVETFTLNGTIAAQTWLNAQDGWLTHIDLFFSQIAKTGDIHVLITETDHGAPDLNKVLARVKIAVEDLKVYPHETKVPIGPVFVTKGRYALVLVTDGAHMACTINGNKYGQGQYFYSGDGGGWFMGDAKIDLAMRLYYAHFNATRAEVQVEPWVLEGGIGDVDILAESFVPEGCQLVWQIRVEGQWRPIASDAPNLLLGLNPLYEARLVFIGTTDLMPSFTFGSASSITTARARTDYTHISKARTMPTGVTLVEVRLRLEDYEQTNHTCVVRLMAGDDFKSLTAPSSVKDYKTEDPNAIERRWQFKFTSLKAYKIKITGTTKSPLNTYHVAERVDIGRTA